MNRRQFLGSLLLFTTPVLTKYDWLVDTEVELPKPLLADSRPLRFSMPGWAAVSDYTICNDTEFPAWWSLKVDDRTLLQLAVGGPGGLCRWVALPGEELYVPLHALRGLVAPNLSTTLIYRDLGNQRLMAMHDGDPVCALNVDRRTFWERLFG